RPPPRSPGDFRFGSLPPASRPETLPRQAIRILRTPKEKIKNRQHGKESAFLPESGNRHARSGPHRPSASTRHTWDAFPETVGPLTQAARISRCRFCPMSPKPEVTGYGFYEPMDTTDTGKNVSEFPVFLITDPDPTFESLW